MDSHLAREGSSSFALPGYLTRLVHRVELHIFFYSLGRAASDHVTEMVRGYLTRPVPCIEPRMYAAKFLPALEGPRVITLQTRRTGLLGCYPLAAPPLGIFYVKPLASPSFTERKRKRSPGNGRGRAAKTKEALRSLTAALR